MQIKNHSITFIPIKMATIKKTQKISSVGKDSEKWEPVGTVGGTLKWYNHYGKQYDSSSKNKNRITMIQKSHLGVNIQKIERKVLKRYVHCSIIHRSKWLETTQMSVDRWMDFFKCDIDSHTHTHEYSSDLKRQEILSHPPTWNYAKWNKSVEKR